MGKRITILQQKGWVISPPNDPITYQKIKKRLTFIDKRYTGTYLVNMLGAKGFKRGLLDYVNEGIEDEEIKVETTNEIPNSLPKEFIDKLKQKNIELRDYQLDAVNAILAHDGIGLINSPTATGKTLMEISLAYVFPKPCLVLAPRIDLMQQLYSDFQKNGVKCSMYGDKYRDLSGDVVIMTMASLVRGKKTLADFKKTIQSIIVDEAHHCTEGLYKILGSMKCQVRVGLSATPLSRDWNLVKKMRLIANFGSVQYDGYKDERTEKYRMNPEVYIIPYNGHSEIDSYKYMLAVRRHDFIQQKRLAVVKNTERNKLIAKLAEVMRVKGLNVFIIVGWTEHMNEFEEVIEQLSYSSGWHFLSGEDEIERREEVYNLMKNKPEKEGAVLCGTVGGEGIDLTHLNAVLLADQFKGENQLIQNMGRAARRPEGKEMAFLVDFPISLFKKFGDKREDIYMYNDFVIKNREELFALLSER